MSAADILLAGESNVGLRRRHNEDNFCYDLSPARKTALAVVADGVGGYSNGRMASLITCRDLLRKYQQTADEELIKNGEAFLRNTVVAINEKIFSRNRFEQQPRPMCTTVVTALFLPEKLVLLNAGDSRCYELRQDGSFYQLTHDHTLWNVYRRRKNNGQYSKPKLYEIVVRALGPRQLLRTETHILPRRPGSRYILCSDGVNHMIDDDVIADCIKQATSPHDAVDRLMRITLRKGGHDNITIIAAFEKEK
ncbi:MAG: serine/threonine-protein phosphatase [Lentisphaeria bacterium]|nr:serine/threonine-protein phosphatase [Lentisphaeria bacterium]MBQ9775471.1 serine/threonine-protein phosphatase [Lentisphaeria bacterium]